MQLKEIKNIFHKELDDVYPTEEVDSLFYWLVEHYLGVERFILAVQPGLVISKEDEGHFFKALARLKLQQPIQYITGETTFLGLTIKVSKKVLIPRPETEELTRWVLSDATERSNPSGGRPLRILDIGTGSGCIAIALAKNLPEAAVYGLEVSTEALEVARENARLNHVQISWVQEDILNLERLQPRFDIIVSNPPYVRDSERSGIRDNVKGFEPAQALFVSNDDPLRFYRHIAGLACHNLTSGGLLYFEINQYLGREMAKLLDDLKFLQIELRNDMFGNERMMRAVKA